MLFVINSNEVAPNIKHNIIIIETDIYGKLILFYIVKVIGWKKLFLGNWDCFSWDIDFFQCGNNVL